MSNLYTTIKSDFKTARLEKNRANTTLLSTLIGDIQQLEKKLKNEIKDSDVIGVVKAFLKNTHISLEKTTEYGKIAELNHEKSVLEGYLPTSLNNGEIDDIIKNNEFVSIQDAMKFFKANYENRYDAKYVASKFTK